MRARDFFESVREASREAERTRHTIMRMEGNERPRGMSLHVGGGSSRTDAMQPSDRLMDYEAMMRRRIDGDWALIDRACVVLYGEDQMGGGGLCADRSSAWADVLYHRYVDALRWAEVGDLLGYSERQCKRMADDALGWMDETEYASALMVV